MRNDNVPEPLNVQEQYLHGILLRVDALCNMVSSLVEHVAKQEGVSVEHVEVKDKRPTARKKKEV